MTQTSVLELAIDELQPGRYQPRHHLREDSLAELAESIREQGVLQPLIVRIVSGVLHGADSKPYEIVAGERRWRAARLAGLATVPVIVRELSDQSTLAVALIENLQREDLNPIDQARSMARLIEEFGLTHDEIAKALGRSRAAVTNFLRLLDLHDEVQFALVSGKLDMGHARALLPLDQKRQVTLARKIVRFGWSVRRVEETVKTILDAPKPKASIDMQARWLEQQLTRELGEKVSIRKGPKGDYVLQLAFVDLAKLETGLRRLQELLQQVRKTAGPRTRDTPS
jgi:ParB family transcriptional regulator, chromosome partitioning protein